MHIRIGCLALTWVLAWLSTGDTAWALRGGQLQLSVVDGKTGQPLACRMHLMNQARKAQKPPKVPFWHDHFVFDGTILLKLPNGTYVFEIERGPEYRVVTGNFTINENAKDEKTIDLNRFVDMTAEGWWSGDLEVVRPAKEVPLLMLADDLHVADVVDWGNAKGVPTKVAPADKLLVDFDAQRCYRLLAGLEQSADGSALVLNGRAPIGHENADASLTAVLEKARESRECWIDVRRGASWDLPIWVALGLVDSIQLADSEQARRSTKADELGSRPRDKLLMSGANGIGRWPETVYYHLLNCGLRIPPSAGSGSGIVPNPVGYDRMYVHLTEPFSYDQWFEAFRAGRVTITNGPLIRPVVEGEMPGHVFQAGAGEQVDLEVGCILSTRDKISYLEVVKNGHRASEVRLDELAKAGGKLPPLVFDESGWFVIRAVTDLPETHRFATTAPYYVEIGYQRRISRSSVRFFLDWLDERVKLNGGKQPSADMEACEQKLRAYWQDLLKKANAE